MTWWAVAGVVVSTVSVTRGLRGWQKVDAWWAEPAAGLASLAVLHRWGVTQMAPLLTAIPALTVLAVIDLRTRTLPRRMIYSAAVVAAAAGLVAAFWNANVGVLVPAAVGALAAFLLFGAIWWLSPSGIGFGDVRLAALVGLLAGYGGPALLTGSFLAGTVLAALVATAARFRTGAHSIPFGPFLALGVMAGAALIGPAPQ